MQPATIEIGKRGWPVSGPVLAVITACLSLGLAVAILVLPPAATIALVVGAVVALITLREPYYGLLAVIALEFLRPQEIFPALAPLHLPRVVTLWVACVWLLRSAVLRKAPVARDRQNAVLVGILVIAALSMIGTFWRGAAFRALLDLTKKVVAFFLIANLAAERPKVRGLVWAFVLFTGWLALNQVLAFRSALSGSMMARIGGGTDSFLGNTIDFAVALAVILPYAVFLIFAERGRALRALAFLLALLFVASMVATGARAGALGLLVLAFVIWLKLPRKAITIALLPVILVGSWYLSPAAYRERVLSIATYQEDASATGRIENWRAAQRMLFDRPLLGVGIGNFPIAYGVAYSPPGEERWASVHNVVLQAAAELGLLGLFAYGLLTCFIIGDNRRTRRLADEVGGERGVWYRHVAHGVDVALVGYLVTSLFATTLYYPHLYLIAGLAVALKHAAQADAAEAGAEGATT